MVQAFETEADHGKGNLDALQCLESLLQVQLHHEVTRHAGDFIQGARQTKTLRLAMPRGLGFVESFHRPDDGTVTVAHRDGPYPNRNLMPGLVVYEPGSMDRLRRFHCARDRALRVTKLASRLIAMKKSFCDARVSQNLVAQMAGEAFGPVTPCDDPLLRVQYADADRKDFQYGASNLGIIKR